MNLNTLAYGPTSLQGHQSITISKEAFKINDLCKHSGSNINNWFHKDEYFSIKYKYIYFFSNLDFMPLYITGWHYKFPVANFSNYHSVFYSVLYWDHPLFWKQNLSKICSERENKILMHWFTHRLRKKKNTGRANKNKTIKICHKRKKKERERNENC